MEQRIMKSKEYKEFIQYRSSRIPIKVFKEVGFSQIIKTADLKKIPYNKIPVLVCKEYFASAPAYVLAKKNPEIFLYLSYEQVSVIKENVFCLLPKDILFQLIEKYKNISELTTEYWFNKNENELLICHNQPSVIDKLKKAIK